ncbi:MAG: hypothetical protein F6K35_29550 [Okeania sp. SIO2H7]|nr:hypothetical protein [Okeania sp. SIO2H7]
MNSTSKKRTARRGRIFPDINLSPEEIARRKAEREAFGQRCRVVFDRVKPELIEDYYNWFIIIEPDSGDYFIDRDDEIAAKKARQQHPDAWLGTFRINETGVCGLI